MSFFCANVLCLIFSIQGLINYQTQYMLVDGLIPFSVFFNDEPEKDIKLNLTAFAFELNERKDEIGYIISYAGKKAKRNETESNIKKFEEFLIEKKKISPKQLVFIDGGHRERGITELYIVPKDAVKPMPVPTIPEEKVIYICEKEID